MYEQTSISISLFANRIAGIVLCNEKSNGEQSSPFHKLLCEINSQ